MLPVVDRRRFPDATSDAYWPWLMMCIVGRRHFPNKHTPRQMRAVLR